MPRKTGTKKAKSGAQALFTVGVRVDPHPRVVYFIPSKNGKGDDQGAHFKEVTDRVRKLQIEPVAGDDEGAHQLRRLDEKEETVWLTRHPSLKEAFWHAEWEYEVKEEEWEKA